MIYDATILNSRKRRSEESTEETEVLYYTLNLGMPINNGRLNVAEWHMIVWMNRGYHIWCDMRRRRGYITLTTEYG